MAEEIKRQLAAWTGKQQSKKKFVEPDPATIFDFEEQDAQQGKTWTRVVVEKYLCKQKWYNPQLGRPDAPSLSKAYAFYEHVSLPRRFVSESDGKLIRAEPGETEAVTALFSPFRTPASAFIEWGAGVDLYFESLKIVAVMLLFAGLLNLPNMMYFASKEYSVNGQSSLGTILKGSAICTNFEWVACPTCQAEDFDTYDGEREKYGVAEDGTILVQRYGCGGARFREGMFIFGTFCFLGLALYLMSKYLQVKEVIADEDKLTATDYSVVVYNPPPDALDPDEWRDYFQQFASNQVTVVTVALDNDVMLRKLLARRQSRNALRLLLAKGTDMDDEDLVLNLIAQLERERDSEPSNCVDKIVSIFIKPPLRLLGLFRTPQEHFDRVVKLTEEIKELQSLEYHATQVFVTFETEEDQRAALDATSVAKTNAWLNNTSGVAPAALFQGKVLLTGEPSEPSAIRWLDLSAGYVKRVIRQLTTLIVTLCMVALAGFIAGVVRNTFGPSVSGIVVSVENTLVPQIIKLLMLLEPHFAEGTFQTSLYVKIALFRWINTAIVPRLISPFTGYLSNNSQDIIPAISSILWSELFITPVLQLSDIVGNLKKHFFGPRARTQEAMNLNFLGTPYNLGERYTNFSKTFFVCCVFAPIYPAVFFFGAAIVTIQHYVDKFSLLRIWGFSPQIGSDIAKLSRNVFFTGCLVTFGVIAAFTYAQFPYDNLCDPEVPSGTNFAGTYLDVTLITEEPTVLESVVVTQEAESVFCAQNWRSNEARFFLATSRVQPDDATYMTDSQVDLTNFFGIFGVICVVVFALGYCAFIGTNSFLALFTATYTPDGQDQKVDFSANTEVYGYVPQIKLRGYPFPFLACDVDQVDQNLIGWNDQANSYDEHNLMFDIPHSSMRRMVKIKGNTRGITAIESTAEYVEATQQEAADTFVAERDVNVRPIYSIVKHYPPEWQRKLANPGGQRASVY